MNSKILAVMLILLLIVSSSFAIEETICLESTFVHDGITAGESDDVNFTQSSEPTDYVVTFDARSLTFSSGVMFDSWVEWDDYHYFESSCTISTPSMIYDSDSRYADGQMGSIGTITNHYSGPGAIGTSYVTTKIKREI